MTRPKSPIFAFPSVPNRMLSGLLVRNKNRNFNKYTSSASHDDQTHGQVNSKEIYRIGTIKYWMYCGSQWKTQVFYCEVIFGRNLKTKSRSLSCSPISIPWRILNGWSHDLHTENMFNWICVYMLWKWLGYEYIIIILTTITKERRPYFQCFICLFFINKYVCTICDAIQILVH